MTTFESKLRDAISANNSLLCVGLDPDPGRMPASYLAGRSPAQAARQFCLDIIAADQ